MWLTAAHRHPWGSVFICYVHLNCHSPFRSCSFSEQYGTHSYLLDSAWSDTSYPPYICTYWKVNHLPSRWCFPNLSTGFVLSDSILCQVCRWICVHLWEWEALPISTYVLGEFQQTAQCAKLCQWCLLQNDIRLTSLSWPDCQLYRGQKEGG